MRFLLLFFILVGHCAFAQTKEISGTVTDGSNMPLPGVNILIKGTSNGTQTDFDGNYTINAATGDILVFSYVGFTNQEIAVGSSSQINATMEAGEALEEVLVVGYGTSTRRNLTDNVASISSDEINEIPVPSIQSTLAAKAAGVQVTQVNGKAESGIKIRVRGVSTISSSQEPLYVIDGIPLINSDENVNDSPINPLISLNPNDIQSIEILKDASSAAIYGARGSNGVVLITTKRGKAGVTKISLNTSYGWSKETNRRDFLNTAQYVDLFSEAYVNSGYTLEDAYADFTDLAGGDEAAWREGTVNTDWQDLIFVDGAVSDLNLNISGGSEKTQFFMSLGHNRTDGIIRGNDLERYNFRANVDHTISDQFKVGLTSSIARTEINRLANDNQFATPVQAIAQLPFTRPFEDNGLPNPNTLYYNFLNQVVNAENKTKIWRAIANAYGQYEILPSLSFRSELGYDLNVQTSQTFSGKLTESQSVGGFAEANSVQNEKYVLNNYFTLNEALSDAINLEATAGMSFEEDRRDIQFVQGQGFPSDDLRTVDSAAEIVGGGSSRTGFTFLSYFGRANLDILNKYLFKASLRYDGSSRFGVNEQYGLFPAASGAWIISDEDFLNESETLSLLKLRASWGVTGNADIGNFASRSLFGGAAYSGRPALTPTQLGDPSLKWENTVQYDFGLDYGILNNRISGEIDYYNKKTTDLLLDEPIPSTSGFTTITRNVGELKNTGVEFVLNTKNIVSEDFNWSSSFNISYNKNEIVSLPGGDIISGQNIVREGEVLGSLFMVEFAGADPENGDALFVLNTLNPDGTRDRSLTNEFNDASRVVVASPFPDIIAGFTNNMYFKNFDFSFTFQGQSGASIYNSGGRFQSASADYYDNQSLDQLNRWQNPGDITNVPQARLFGANGTQNSSRYLQNADFIRLRNISFGYTLPESFTSKSNIDRLRIYLTGVNLLTITNYDGYDPESTYDIQANSSINVGNAFYSAPPAKTFTLGLSLDF